MDLWGPDNARMFANTVQIDCIVLISWDCEIVAAMLSFKLCHFINHKVVSDMFVVV